MRKVGNVGDGNLKCFRFSRYRILARRKVLTNWGCFTIFVSRFIFYLGRLELQRRYSIQVPIQDETILSC
jgi:hypothetical protein